MCPPCRDAPATPVLGIAMSERSRPGPSPYQAKWTKRDGGKLRRWLPSATLDNPNTWRNYFKLERVREAAPTATATGLRGLYIV